MCSECKRPEFHRGKWKWGRGGGIRKMEGALGGVRKINEWQMRREGEANTVSTFWFCFQSEFVF